MKVYRYWIGSLTFDGNVFCGLETADVVELEGVKYAKYGTNLSPLGANEGELAWHPTRDAAAAAAAERLEAAGRKLLEKAAAIRDIATPAGATA
jgi:hypothetical protein